MFQKVQEVSEMNGHQGNLSKTDGENEKENKADFRRGSKGEMRISKQTNKKYVRLKDWTTGKQITDILHQQANKVNNKCLKF